jgi:hypothetical protein
MVRCRRLARPRCCGLLSGQARPKARAQRRTDGRTAGTDTTGPARAAVGGTHRSHRGKFGNTWCTALLDGSDEFTAAS